MRGTNVALRKARWSLAWLILALMLVSCLTAWPARAVRQGGLTSPAWGWRQPLVLTRPSGRIGATMAYDAAMGRVVLVGGFGSEPLDASHADMWSWAGAGWVPVAATVRPPARWEAAMAYDEATGQLLLFGGLNSTALGDTWLWDGRRWTRSSAPGPPARYGAAMAYDAASREIVLYGGMAWTDHKPVMFTDTWTWDGNRWTERPPTPAPSVSAGASMPYRPQTTTVPSVTAGASMSYVSRTRTVILFGGTGPTGYSDRTWAWNDDRWTQLDPSRSPPGRVESSMARAGSGSVVLFGGYGRQGKLADTWIWDGTTWTQLAVSHGPPGRGDAAMAFDPANDDALLFGGSGHPWSTIGSTGVELGSSIYDDTWTFTPTTKTASASS